eukprot:3125664-Rhodomonas_salina.3
MQFERRRSCPQRREPSLSTGPLPAPAPAPRLPDPALRPVATVPSQAAHALTASRGKMMLLTSH